MMEYLRIILYPFFSRIFTSSILFSLKPLLSSLCMLSPSHYLLSKPSSFRCLATSDTDSIPTSSSILLFTRTVLLVPHCTSIISSSISSASFYDFYYWSQIIINSMNINKSSAESIRNGPHSHYRTEAVLDDFNC